MFAQTLTREKTTHRQPTVQCVPQPSLQYSSSDSFLIIGYGNELCGDEAVGAQVARQIARWQLPQVRAIVVPQLLPELTTEMMNADYVIFVDACGHKSCAFSVQAEPLSSSDAHTLLVASSTAEPFLIHHHGVTPRHSAQGLLALTHKLYGYAPQGWIIQVPVEKFDCGAGLSSTAQRGVDEAVRTIERFLVNYGFCRLACHSA